jgi:phospholipid transport system substrate-binding protein
MNTQKLAQCFNIGLLIVGLLCLSPISLASKGISVEDNPVTLLSKVAKKVDLRLKNEFKKEQDNKDLFYSLVHDELLPIINMDALVRSVVGVRYWKKASLDQKVIIKTYFKKMVLNTYVGAINAYSGHKVYFRRYQGKVHAHYAMVRSLIVLPSQQKVHVNYTMRRDLGRWKVLDFTVDGISFANNYRSQFAPVLKRSGIEGLIKELEKFSKKKQQGKIKG